MPRMEVIDSGIGEALGQLVSGLGPASMAKSRAQALALQAGIDLHAAQRRNVLLDTDWEEEQRKARREAAAAAGRALDQQQTSVGSAVDDPAQAARLNASKAINTAGIYTSSDVVGAGYGGLSRGQAYSYGLPAGEEARRALQTAMGGSIPDARVPLSEEQRKVLETEQFNREMAKTKLVQGEETRRQLLKPFETQPGRGYAVTREQLDVNPAIGQLPGAIQPIGPNEILTYRPAGAGSGASTSTGAVPGPNTGPAAVPASAPAPLGGVPGTGPSGAGAVSGSAGGQTGGGAVLSTVGADANFFIPNDPNDLSKGGHPVFSRDGRTDLSGAPLPPTAIQIKDPDVTKLGQLGKPDPKQLREARKDVADSDEAKTYAKILPIWNGVVESAYRSTKADDLNTIYSTASILDPGSVVREGEALMVRGTGSMADYWRGLIAQVSGEGALQAQTKADLLRMLDSRVGQYEAAYNSKIEGWRYVAEQNGWDMRQIELMPMRRAVLDPARINSIGHAPLPAAAATTTPPPQAGGATPPPQPTPGPVVDQTGVPRTPGKIVRPAGRGFEISEDGGRTWRAY